MLILVVSYDNGLKVQSIVLEFLNRGISETTFPITFYYDFTSTKQTKNPGPPFQKHYFN